MCRSISKRASWLRPLTTAVVAAAALCLLPGCTADDPLPAYLPAKMIGFSPSVGTTASPSRSTRSGVDFSRYSSSPLTGSPLWLVANGSEAARGRSRFGQEPTRAEEVTTANFPDVISDFGVYAYTFRGTWDSSMATTYIDGEEIEKQGDYWAASSPHYWPGAIYKMRFFAFAPYSVGYELSDAKEPILYYTVSQKAEEQQDLLATWASLAEGDSTTLDIPGNHNARLDLEFRHIMTEVTLRADSDLNLGGLKKVTISGVQATGRFNASSMTWEKDYSSATSSFTSSPEASAFTTDLLTGTHTFMMLPQQLPETVTMTIEFEKGTLSGSIGGSGKVAWTPGSRVVYTVSRSGDINVFEVVPSEIDIPDAGGDVSFTVKSYTIDSKTKEVKAQPWKITGADGTTTMFNSWEEWWTYTESWRQESQRAYGSGGSEGDKRGAFQALALPSGYWPASPALSVPTNINSQMWDLSLPCPEDVNNPVQIHDVSKRNTANAYIFYGQNNFIIPAAYGPSIRNGVDMKSVYAGFPDYAGRPITSGYLSEDDFDGVELVWEDVPNLIETLKAVKWGDIKNIPGGSASTDPDDRMFIQMSWRLSAFDMADVQSVRQGNAIVAAYKGSGADKKIVWSWHIWICNYKSDNYLTHNGVKFLPYDVGFTSSIVGGQRQMTVSFLQENTGKTATLTLVQGKKVVVKVPAALFHYQWGRKDLFLSTNRTLYTTDNTLNMEVKEVPDYIEATGGSLSDAILHPGVFYSDWSPTSNYWSGTSKTLFDPCPPGFRMPSGAELSAIIDVLPAIGYRDAAGVVHHEGKYYYSGDYGKFYASPSVGAFNPACGFAVRPVKEDQSD